MQLPWSRPRLFEICDQPWCPDIIRQAVQSNLTFLWTHRIPPFQARAPYERVTEILDELVDELGNEQVRIVDCCSGGGGPMPAIERSINAKRVSRSLKPIPVLLTDLHPPLMQWAPHSRASPTKSLSYAPHSVDATRFPEDISKKKHIRTFCLAFHHFDEQGARRVLEDAMLTSEAVCILELQDFAPSSLLTTAMVGPLCLLLTPFQNPNALAIILTYFLPMIPFILVIDGLVSCWRTRSAAHVEHLSKLATIAIALEGREQDSGWQWTSGRERHSWPGGDMVYMIGTKRPDTGFESD